MRLIADVNSLPPEEVPIDSNFGLFNFASAKLKCLKSPSVFWTIPNNRLHPVTISLAKIIISVLRCLWLFFQGFWVYNHRTVPYRREQTPGADWLITGWQGSCLLLPPEHQRKTCCFIDMMFVTRLKWFLHLLILCLGLKICAVFITVQNSTGSTTIDFAFEKLSYVLCTIYEFFFLALLLGFNKVKCSEFMTYSVANVLFNVIKPMTLSR